MEQLSVETGNKFSLKMLEEMREKLTPPIEPIKPTGTAAFKIDINGYEITVIENPMMLDSYALVSPKLYSQLYHYFIDQTQNKQQP